MRLQGTYMVYIYTYIIFTYTHNIQHKVYIIQPTHVQSIASCPFTGSSLLYGSQQLQLIWKNKHVQWLNPHVGWLSKYFFAYDIHTRSSRYDDNRYTDMYMICICPMFSWPMASTPKKETKEHLTPQRRPPSGDL